MASKVDICNLALSHIAQGAIPITAIEPPDSSFYAELASQHYPTARDLILQMHEWTFATTRMELASISNPSTQWAFAYDLPTGVIRPLAVLPFGATNDNQGLPYRIETDNLTDAQMVLTNVDQDTMKYIRRQDDATRYSPAFVMALSYLLAHFLAGPITKKQSMVDGMYKVFLTHFQIAAGLNAQSTDESAYKDHVPASMRVRGIASRGSSDLTGPLPDGFILRG